MPRQSACGAEPISRLNLDTGAVDTDLNQVFAKELPALVSSEKKETHTITGFGGTNNFDSIVLPYLTSRSAIKM